MRLWKWLGLVLVFLAAHSARARPIAAFPSEFPAAGAAQAIDEQSAAPEPVVHDVASEQQPKPLIAPVASPTRSPRPASELPPVARRYGGYTLMTDGISLASAILGGFTEPQGEAFLWMAGGGYLIGAPIVHLVHGNPGRAAGSLGLRVGLPLAFVGVGTLIDDCRLGEFCGFGTILFGSTLGAAAAIALDAAVLARDTVERPLPLVPTAALGPHSVSIGLAGAF